MARVHSAGHHSPNYLAFITYAPSDHLDALWLKGAIDAAARKLRLPNIVGLEDRETLVTIDDHEDASIESLERSVFLILLTFGPTLTPPLQGRVDHFLARPTQTNARDYLIPIVVPAGAQPLSERFEALATPWVPTFARRVDDEMGDAWTRVTEQTVALMARVLMSDVDPPGINDPRVMAPLGRYDAPQVALTTARSLVEEIEAHQNELLTAREQLDTASSQLIAQCLQTASISWGLRSSSAQQIQADLTRASEAYHDTLEAIVEDAARSALATERRAEAQQRGLRAFDDDFVPPLDSILSELYDMIAPEDDEADESDGRMPKKALRLRRSGRRIGALLGAVLGPFGALMGGIVGDALAHRRSKEALTAAVKSQAEAIVDRAQSTVDAALQSIEGELSALRLQWQSRVEALDSLEDSAPADVVECSV
ncbi:MAG: hypothetical protein AAFV29_08280, partial [Myxococcota bacterium]